MKLSPRRLTFALSLSLSFALCACSVEPSTGADEEALTAPTIVGKYQFVWEGARKADVYRALESKLSGAELERAKLEADEEAAASVIEFAADGTFHSWIGAEEIATAKYVVESKDDAGVTLAMNGRSVHVRFDDDDIVIEDPTKGELTFRRSR